MSYLQENREDQALAVYREDTRAYIHTLQNLFGDLRIEMEREKEEALAASMDSRVFSQQILIGMTGIALIIGILVALLISRGITKPVYQLVKLAERAEKET